MTKLQKSGDKLGSQTFQGRLRIVNQLNVEKI